jgi:hypothetical protein
MLYKKGQIRGWQVQVQLEFLLTRLLVQDPTWFSGCRVHLRSLQLSTQITPAKIARSSPGSYLHFQYRSPIIAQKSENVALLQYFLA